MLKLFLQELKFEMLNRFSKIMIEENSPIYFILYLKFYKYKYFYVFFKKKFNYVFFLRNFKYI